MSTPLSRVITNEIFRVPARRQRKPVVKPSDIPDTERLHRPPGGSEMAASRGEEKISMSMYQRINGADWRNIFVVGDLHGCYTLLMNELEKVSFDPARDLLISVGDLVDRGTENVECLELITIPWFRAVRGNHEQMMVDGLSEYGNVNHWLVNGGGWFFNLDYDKEVLTKALVHKAAELPLVIELVTAERKIVICHADYPHSEYEFDKPVTKDMVIWNRERVSDAQDGIVSPIAGADLFIFGHTPARQPLKYANQMYIDTGAVFCGNLTLVQVQGGSHA